MDITVVGVDTTASTCTDLTDVKATGKDTSVNGVAIVGEGESNNSVADNDDLVNVVLGEGELTSSVKEEIVEATSVN